MKNLNKKKFYEAPDTIVVSFKTERGFAASGDQPVDPNYSIGTMTNNEDNNGYYADRNGYGATDNQSWF